MSPRARVDESHVLERGGLALASRDAQPRFIGRLPPDRPIRVASVWNTASPDVCRAAGISPETDWSEALSWSLRHSLADIAFMAEDGG